MGVGAFIMAEMLGISYGRVAAGAIIPAVAYYFAVFVLVDRLAAKRASRLDGSVDTTIKVDRKILPRLYLLLPAVILVVMIIRGASLMRAGMMGIVSCLICDVVSYFINEKKDFVDLKGIWNCCLDGAKQAAEIAIPTAACGIMIGIVVNSGVAVKIAKLIGTSGEGSLFIALLIAALGCLLLGMALPTVAAYLVGVILFVPCLRQPHPQQLHIAPMPYPDACANVQKGFQHRALSFIRRSKAFAYPGLIGIQALPQQPVGLLFSDAFGIGPGLTLGAVAHVPVGPVGVGGLGKALPGLEKVRSRLAEGAGSLGPGSQDGDGRGEEQGK